MLTLTHVLCATDFSAVSAKAETYAIALARQFDARLSLLHVDPPSPVALPYAGLPVDAGLFDEQRRQADREMQAAHERAQAAGVDVHSTVRGGAPAREILDAAAGNVDLIVMGTHGHDGLEHLVLGSVAEKVLRKARCPVLVVPPAAEPRQGVLFARILCPIDGSEASAAAVDFAVSLARETDGTIHLLQVVEPQPRTRAIGGPAGEAYDTRAEAVASGILIDAVSFEVREWCRIEEEVVRGKASERILAAGGRADIIVMGVRGRHALDMLAFGSTTNDVVRRAACPVLVVHPVRGDRPKASARDAMLHRGDARLTSS